MSVSDEDELSVEDYVTQLRTDLNHSFKECNFDGKVMKFKIMTEMDYERASFRGAKLNFSSMENSNFRGADFSGANLEGANLRGSDCRGADFSGANMEKMVVNERTQVDEATKNNLTQEQRNSVSFAPANTNEFGEDFDGWPDKFFSGQV